MSPKKITTLAFAVGAISLVALIGLLVIGAFSWWPVAGMGLAVLLLVVSFLRGAYLTAQQRVAMVDKLNDCYQGNAKTE